MVAELRLRRLVEHSARVVRGHQRRRAAAVQDPGGKHAGRAADERQQEVLVTAPTSAPELAAYSAPGFVDARVMGKPEQHSAEPKQLADWIFKMRAYLGAADQRCLEQRQATEASAVPWVSATLSSDLARLTTQLCCVFVIATPGSALDKCSNAWLRGVAAVRAECEPELRTRRDTRLRRTVKQGRRRRRKDRRETRDPRYHEEPLRKAKTKAKEVGKPTSDLQSAHFACLLSFFISCCLACLPRF